MINDAKVYRIVMGTFHDSHDIEKKNFFCDTRCISKQFKEKFP